MLLHYSINFLIMNRIISSLSWWGERGSWPEHLYLLYHKRDECFFRLCNNIRAKWWKWVIVSKQIMEWFSILILWHIYCLISILLAMIQLTVSKTRNNEGKTRQRKHIVFPLSLVGSTIRWQFTVEAFRLSRPHGQHHVSGVMMRMQVVVTLNLHQERLDVKSPPSPASTPWSPSPLAVSAPSHWVSATPRVWQEETITPAKFSLHRSQLFPGFIIALFLFSPPPSSTLALHFWFWAFQSFCSQACTGLFQASLPPSLPFFCSFSFSSFNIIGIAGVVPAGDAKTTSTKEEEGRNRGWCA